MLTAHTLSCVRQHKSIFTDLSLSLSDGDLLLVEGPNGAGKSSLLRLLAGLATPNQGEIFWHKQPISDERAQYLEQLHYIGHSSGIKLGLNVVENLKLMAYLATQTLNQTDSNDILRQLQLEKQSHLFAKHLSAGQRRRVALAKLYLFPKRVWILDEPLTALDTNTQQFFINRLEQHLDQGGIAIISSHQPIQIARKMKNLRLATC